MTAAPASGGSVTGMVFHVDAWDPTYGSGVETAETIADSTPDP